jgi:hypothetical protein
MQEREGAADQSKAVTTRSVEVVVAVVFLVIGAVVIIDSLRVGAGWDSDAPGAGYFPFYIGLMMSAASIMILIQALVSKSSGLAKPFVDPVAFRPVLLVLAPTLVYVLVIEFLGIYTASAIFIGAFMVYFGSYGWTKTIAVSVLVPAAMFMMFEIWFLVPLPKGPLEALFGY